MIEVVVTILAALFIGWAHMTSNKEDCSCTCGRDCDGVFQSGSSGR